MTYKKLISGFGCREGQAIVLDNKMVCEEDILTLCRRYSDNGADELLIYDLSQTEEDHERTILLIKDIAREIDIPILAGGRVRRLEDIKKYLYAGAKAVFLDVADDANVDLMKEGSHRFGGEKIYGYLPEPSFLNRAEEFEQLGASALLIGREGEETEKELGDLLAGCPMPVFVFCREDPLGETSSLLQIPCVEAAVLTSSREDEGGFMRLKQELKKKNIPVDTFESSVSWDAFKLDSNGMIPVITQDYRTSQVLMLAYMNREAFEKTLETGKMTYFSRSRKTLWLKGETSGHFQYVKSLHLDCDNDTILAKVKQVGAACHTGARSCFFQTLAEREYRNTNPLKVFEDVFKVILDRKEHPKEGSYTNYLFDKGLDKILKKLGEEATEIIIAAKNPNPEEIKYEISDFLYHMMVLMADRGITWEEIMEELASR
ncbi:MAG: bifunctional phosphoribosyl-AMP cyclohydrolase/phosphoribosyl-ATP diphosphatase HisIE [Hungatella sp.]|nr:bifunctional phosphoribosyl-AMP cyclohydrolase/phosphoribosyl-ATP diphosphatase HisIE [Hungatella sp.]